MEILLLIEKWCDLNPDLGTTSGNYNLLGSLKAANLANVTTFYYDEYFVQNGKNIEEFLINYLNEHKIDKIVINYYPYEDHRNITFRTMEHARMLNIPIVFTWFDFVHDHIKALVFRMFDYSSLNVVIDTHFVHDKFISLWSPQDPTVFFNPQRHRNLPICFVGTTHGYTDRQRYLGYLNASGVNVHRSGGQREHHLTMEQYAHILQDSKMSINFCEKNGGFVQLKGRVFESMLCGAMLLEKQNHQITHWYEPMVHYVPFDGEGDLKDKIHYYATHENERMTIANNGWRKTTQEYNHVNWWKRALFPANV